MSDVTQEVIANRLSVLSEVLHDGSDGQYLLRSHSIFVVKHYIRGGYIPTNGA
jgi:hypothetical protein